MKKRLSLLFSTLLMCIITFAQMQTPVKFKSELKKLSDNQLEVVFTGTIDEGWHVYSTGLGEDGPTSANKEVRPYIRDECKILRKDCEIHSKT